MRFLPPDGAKGNVQRRKQETNEIKAYLHSNMAAAYADFDNSDEHEVSLSCRCWVLVMKQGDPSSKKCAENYDISLARKLFHSVCTISFKAVGDARNGDAFHWSLSTIAATLELHHRHPAPPAPGGQDVKQSHGPEVFFRVTLFVLHSWLLSSFDFFCLMHFVVFRDVCRLFCRILGFCVLGL